jgi:hypothetical protein
METQVTRQYSSELIDLLATALAKAQAEIKNATKDVDNTFFKAKYADLASCVEAAKDALCKNGLSVVQMADFDATGQWLVTQLMHSSGQWMRSYYPVKPVKPDPQALGSAITYARRYAYCAITGVVAAGEDDDGNEASGKKETAKSNVKRFEAIKKAIAESNDPSIAWGENLADINGFLDYDKTYYDELVKVGAKRKEELKQMEQIRASMPQGFNDIKGE